MFHDLFGRPIEGPGQLHHEVDLRETAGRHEVARVAPESFGELPPRPPAVGLGQCQEMFEAIPPCVLVFHVRSLLTFAVTCRALLRIQRLYCEREVTPEEASKIRGEAVWDVFDFREHAGVLLRRRPKQAC